MGSIREALVRNGIYYFTNGGSTYQIEDGAGCYMVARDSSGIVRYRIESASISNKLIVRDMLSGSVIQYLTV